jgi:hypothetical protein
MKRFSRRGSLSISGFFAALRLCVKTSANQPQRRSSRKDAKPQSRKVRAAVQYHVFQLIDFFLEAPLAGFARCTASDDAFGRMQSEDGRESSKNADSTDLDCVARRLR